jgi:hypothetical protein
MEPSLVARIRPAARRLRASLLLLLLASAASIVGAQEAPYFVTYDHHLEEPGNLEVETSSTLGVPRSGQRLFFAPYTKIEYGVAGRWTSELYFEGQSTSGDSAVFTGWRLETGSGLSSVSTGSIPCSISNTKA